MTWVQMGAVHVLGFEKRPLGSLKPGPGGWVFDPVWKSGTLGPWSSLEEAKAEAEREAQEALS